MPKEMMGIAIELEITGEWQFSIIIHASIDHNEGSPLLFPPAQTG